MELDYLDFLTQPLPGLEVGGNLSPWSIWATFGLLTFPPLGPTSTYVPLGLLSVPGFIGFVLSPPLPITDYINKGRFIGQLITHI